MKRECVKGRKEKPEKKQIPITKVEVVRSSYLDCELLLV